MTQSHEEVQTPKRVLVILILSYNYEMLNQDLQQFIEKSRQAGKTDDQIRQELLGAGWTIEDIEKVSFQENSKSILNTKPKKVQDLLDDLVALLPIVSAICLGFFAFVGAWAGYAGGKYVIGIISDKIFVISTISIFILSSGYLVIKFFKNRKRVVVPRSDIIQHSYSLGIKKTLLSVTFILIGLALIFSFFLWRLKILI